MKSKSVAYLLWLVSCFGWLGLHRLYLGKPGTMLLWIITFGFFGVGSLIDLFKLGNDVDIYNAHLELKELRKSALANQRD